MHGIKTKRNSSAAVAALLTLAALLVCFALAGAVRAATDRKCMSCHEREDYRTLSSSRSGKMLYVDGVSLRASAHGETQCVECHDDVAQLPHEKELHKVKCSRCHDSDTESLVGLPGKEEHWEYESVTHGNLFDLVNDGTPTCQDCHGTHEVAGSDDPASLVYRANIPETCGRCHEDAYVAYRGSVHGKLIEKGGLDAPVCTDCHGSHRVLDPNDPSSLVFDFNIVETCGRCHENETVMRKYGMSAEQVAAYRESLHGIAGKFGDARVANCASCHGFHDIRGQSDPLSSIHPANLAKTCGQKGCHPGGRSKKLANGRIHVSSRSAEAGLVHWVALGYKLLITSSVCGFLCYIGCDLIWNWIERRRKSDRSGR